MKTFGISNESPAHIRSNVQKLLWKLAWVLVCCMSEGVPCVWLPVIEIIYFLNDRCPLPISGMKNFTEMRRCRSDDARDILPFDYSIRPLLFLFHFLINRLFPQRHWKARARGLTGTGPGKGGSTSYPLFPLSVLPPQFHARYAVRFPTLLHYFHLPRSSSPTTLHSIALLLRLLSAVCTPLLLELWRPSQWHRPSTSRPRPRPSPELASHLLQAMPPSL